MSEAICSENDKYIVVSSNDCLNYFPDNNPTNFTTIVDPSLNLKGQWVVGLKDIFLECETLETAPVTTRGGHVIFDIFLAQTSGAFLAGRESSLLRRVTFYAECKRCKSLYAQFENPQMTPIVSQTLDRLEVYIRPVRPNDLSFSLQTATRATLVLKKLD